MSSPRLVSGVSPIVEKPFVEIDPVNSRSSIKLVDLFAGIGGFHFGIAAAASKRNKSVKPLLVAEIEPSCQVTYAANLTLLDEFYTYPNFEFEGKDINDLEFLYDCDYVINTAAETHVGNSIVKSDDFIHSNINGVHHLLELLRNFRQE